MPTTRREEIGRRMRLFRESEMWRSWIKPVLAIVVGLSTFRSAVADWYDVPTGSMKPTILEGDRIFVNKLAYDLRVPFAGWQLASWGEPKRGEVVVLISPADGISLVKRVIAGPGDRIELRNNRLFVNDESASYQPLDPSVFSQLAATERRGHRFTSETIDGHQHPMMTARSGSELEFYGPVTLPPGQYFVMGDNRDNSFDSRLFGFVNRDRILGRALAVVFSRDHLVPRWDRFFRAMP
jgi:signal peptidase I